VVSAIGFNRATTILALDTTLETLETMTINIQAILFDHFEFGGGDAWFPGEPPTFNEERSGTPPPPPPPPGGGGGGGGGGGWAVELVVLEMDGLRG
jgi:hypothetical protein